LTPYPPTLHFQNHNKFQNFDNFEAVFDTNLSNSESFSAFLTTN
jgi:hypothetical protein